MLDFTPVFKLYAHTRRRALTRQNAAKAQERQLAALLAQARNTRFGRDHSFSKIRTIADFQRAVPLRRYEAMWTDYWQKDFPNLLDISWPGKIPFFAATSGTTSGTSKYIPVTEAMNRANTRAAFDVLVHHLANRPLSRALGGKTFMLGGSTTLVKQTDGVFAGDLSGIAFRQTPPWFRGRTFPPPAISGEHDWEKKMDAIAALAPGEDIRIAGGTPTWLLRLFERQQALTQKDIQSLYPKLELLVHGAVNFKPYRERFAALLPRVDFREVYAASEGFIALQDETPGEGLRVMADNGLFLEFVPISELDSASPTRHALADIAVGEDYALALSSCAGCWAYLIGDTVRFVSRDPPRLLITGRTSYFMSAFGEHLTGEEIENAVSTAAKDIGVFVTDFAMGAIHAVPPETKGRHRYVVEFAEPPPPESLWCFAAKLDDTLREQNDDYRHYRNGDILIRPPEIVLAPPGSFAAWMKARGRMGGQNKVPRVINDTNLFGHLQAFVSQQK